MEGGTTKSEGLCLKCAKEMGIKPVEDMMQKMGISDEDLEGLTNEMMSAFGGAEGMEGLMSAEEAEKTRRTRAKPPPSPSSTSSLARLKAPRPSPLSGAAPRRARRQGQEGRKAAQAQVFGELLHLPDSEGR